LDQRRARRLLLSPCYDGSASLHLERGDDALADEYMAKAQEICERTGLDPDSFVILPFLE
jgi:adenylate cyclase